MSLITRCPACATMFKVVPDQLRISEGWVRCGHCAEVFDASANIQQPAAPAVVTADFPAFSASDFSAPAPSVPAAPSEPDASVLPTPQPEPAPAPAVQLPPESLPPEPELAAFQPSLLPQPVAASGASSRPAALDPFPEERDDVAPSPVTDSTLESVSFVRDARRKAFWRRPAVRVMLSLVVLLLVAVLGLQVAVQERNRIAAMEPRALPWLQQLCVHLQCAVEPLRQIESIVIDSSSFTKLRTDAYRLSVTLKNNSQLALAMPAIELALTDSADQPVLRRVLMPADLGAAAPNLSPVLAPGGEWSGTFPLGVSGNNSRIVGYRLLAFYP